MKIEVKVEGEVLQPQFLDGFKDGTYEIDIKSMSTRTTSQNSSQWLWLQQIANRLNDINVPTTQILRADIKWNKEKVKYMFFDPIMEASYGKKSTTKLNKDEYELIILTLIKAFGQRGITLPAFPSLGNKKD